MYLLILLILICGSVKAQDLKCFYCGKTIESDYTEVDGHVYHPGHFLCAICNKPINGSFTKDSGHYYHLNCFRENKLERCAVCNRPLEGAYYIDAFNNKYHAAHESEYSKCSNCGRLICSSITHGGKSYGDSRNMCNICFKDAVFADSDFNRLLKKVIRALNSMGLNIPGGNITIQAVSLYELQRQIGSKGSSDNLQGFCKSEKDIISNGKTSVKHKIYLLNGMPSITTEQVIAHELMHAWLFVNSNEDENESTVEGSCNYIAYLYLRSSGDTDASFNILKLEESPDRIYGQGFRDIKSKFENKPLYSLLDYLKNL